MKLTTIPADFASAYDDNYFVFEEVDASTPTEVAFLDAEGERLGARRYASRESIQTSPRSLLERLLEPRPVVEGGCRFLFGADRQTALAVEFDGGAQSSPLVHFTAAHTPTPLHSVMGGSEQYRTLSAGEHDEVAFRAAVGDSLVAMVMMDGAVPTFLCGATARQSGVHVLIVDADEILERTGQKPESFDVSITIGGVRVATIHYRLRSVAKGAVRLAWLNREGYISYHTFPAPLSERVVCARSECETPYGTLILGGASWREKTLGSGFLSAEQAEQLVGLVTSPRVWLLEGEVAKPQTIISHTMQLCGEGGRTLRLEVRDARKEEQ